MLEDFTTTDVDVDGTRVHAVVGGEGPPLLMLHGYPQTHVMWHAVAPVLARTHTVVLPDLRGYGDSDRPASQPDHAQASKRAMAADQVGLMRHLGFETFAVVGHDRGARVAHRLCLDHPAAVTRVALLDIAPTRHVLTHVDLALATAYHHWFLLAQTADLPERLLGADPAYWVRRKLVQWSAADGIEAFDDEAVAAYVAAFEDPEVVRATCEDYRAGLGVDLVHDEASHAAGQRVTCPALVLWGADGFVGSAYDVPAVWRAYAEQVTGRALPGGHFLPEENPAGTLEALVPFLT
ncbi:alpha/beta hydrolase [Nocardioides korecus]